MFKPLVSMIIPVYNVEKYLNKCLNTVINQTYKNLEIILIDDGSTDGSYKICDEWENTDKRVKVIHKKNQGLGMARNTGLEYANGEFVMFVDSDDFLEFNAVEKLFNAIKESDTVFCGHTVYYGEDKLEKKPIKYDNLSFSGLEIKDKILIEMMGALPSDNDDIFLPVSVWHGLYSMRIIREYNIKFPSERQFISEDMIFHIDYLSVSKSVSFISDCLYYYRKDNENSLTTIYNPKRFEKEVVLYKELERRLSFLMQRDKFILRLQRTFLGRVRSCIVRAVKSNKNTRKEIKIICENQSVQDILREYPYKECNMKLKIFNFCLHNKFILLLCVIVKMRYKMAKSV